MSDQDAMENKYGDISAIDARLAELEREKQQLIDRREQLRKPEPTASVSNFLTPEQKITIYSRLFRGRTDIFANRWQNQLARKFHEGGWKKGGKSLKIRVSRPQKQEFPP